MQAGEGKVIQDGGRAELLLRLQAAPERDKTEKEDKREPPQDGLAAEPKSPQAGREIPQFGTRKSLLDHLKASLPDRRLAVPHADASVGGQGGPRKSAQEALEALVQERRCRQRKRVAPWTIDAARPRKVGRLAEMERTPAGAASGALSRLIGGSSGMGMGGETPRNQPRNKCGGEAGCQGGQVGGLGVCPTRSGPEEEAGAPAAATAAVALADASNSEADHGGRENEEASSWRSGPMTAGPEDQVGEAPPTQSAGTAEGSRVIAGLGHRLIKTGSVLWCRRCGGHAEVRVGTALGGNCQPIQEGEKGGRASRLRLLLQGRHPISKRPLK
jgi:hypothetical protein